MTIIQTAERGAKTAGAAQTKTINALLLDDSEFDRKRIRRMVRDMGYAIELDDAASLAAFERKLNTRPYDMIFIDYLLPEGDGLDALALIKACASNCNAATIMVSGESDIDVAITAMKSGFNDYLSKQNLSLQSLQQAVSGALQDSSLKSDSISNAELQKVIFDIVKRISDSCFDEMRPLLAQALRNTRSAQHMNTSASPQLTTHLSVVEASCMTLCTFLEEISAIKTGYAPDDQPSKGATIVRT